MAGLDGIKNKIHPGEAMDKNLYDLPPEEAKEIPQVAGSLEEALNALDADREFLTAGGVFTNDAIDAYIALRIEENDRVRYQGCFVAVETFSPSQDGLFSPPTR
ncbi:glutamine synthetase [Klebsiella pneumoniae]|nr:glutamine synthetase [Klebsiella pneumoniae]